MQILFFWDTMLYVLVGVGAGVLAASGLLLRVTRRAES
jgi:hypothetical protein